MAVCLDTVTSIRLTAVTFKYKLLTFSEVNMIGKIWDFTIKIVEAMPIYEEFTRVWKDYKWPIFPGMENDPTIPVERWRILVDLEIKVDILEGNNNDYYSFFCTSLPIERHYKTLDIQWENFKALLNVQWLKIHKNDILKFYNFLNNCRWK